jgi:DivIVA domain-containing protein
MSNVLGGERLVHGAWHDRGVYWFFTALIAAVVVAIALIAAGRGDIMARTWPDRRYLSLPEDRSLTAGDVESLRLAVAFRGYRMEEVDDLLDRIGVELAARDAYIERLQREVSGGRNHAESGYEGRPAAEEAATRPEDRSDEARTPR